MIDRDRQAPELGVEPQREPVNAHHDPDSHDRSTHATLDGDGAAPAWGAMQRHAMAQRTGALAARLHTPAVPLPHRAQLERAFGTSLGDLQAHVGEAEAVRALGGVAAAEGDVIAFADASPSLSTVAHEVTHVLQARSGKPGGGAAAEREAERIEADIAAGHAPAPVEQGAHGIHLKDTPGTPAPLSAREFLHEMRSVSAVAIPVLYATNVVGRHPFGRYVGSPDELLHAMFQWGKPGALFTSPFVDKIGGLVAPESLDAIVDSARRTEQFGSAHVGPSHHLYIEPVGFALGNALGRRLRQSLTRMLPRLANEADLERDEQGNVLPPKLVPQPAWLTVSHPLDRALAYGLCAPEANIDLARFATDHPGLVKAEQRAQGRTVDVRFPYERNLWHWVEAVPSDASAEEVAVALFGNADQAYRLTPMAPLFGFRGSDVAAFRPEKRAELDRLAAQHHPHPLVRNAGEIANIENQKKLDEHERQRQAELDAQRRPQFTQHPTIASGFPAPAGMQPAPTPAPTGPQAPAPDKAYPIGADVDPAVELALATGESYARDRARAMGGDGKRKDEAAVYERLGDCLDLLDPMVEAFAMLDSKLDLAAVRGDFLGRRREAAATCLADPDGAYALADQQAKVLRTLSKTTGDAAAHVLMFGGVSAKDGAMASAQQLGPGTREAVAEAAQALGEAAAALPFPELAGPRTEHAAVLVRALRITILENNLHKTRPTLQDAMDTPGDRHGDTADYDPERYAQRNDHMLFELAKLRVDVEEDPVAAEQGLACVQEQGSDYLMEMSVIANLEALDAVWKSVEDSEDFWKGTGDTLEGNALQAQNRGYYATFRDKVFEPYKAAVDKQDREAKQAAKQAFKELVENDHFKKHFKAVEQHLKDTAKHKRWAKIIVGIGIAVVAMALGQWAFAGYLAAGGGILGAAVIGGTVETGVSTLLNKVILDADPSAGSLITGFVGAGAMYAVVGRSIAAGRAIGAGAEVVEAVEKVGFAAKAGKVAVDTTKELILVQAMGAVQAQVANLIDHGALMTEAQLHEMLVHNVASLIGMKIGQRVVDVTLDPMKPLRELGKRHDIHIDALLAEQAEIAKLAKQLEAAKDQADPGQAHALIDRERAFLQHEHEVRTQLLELAKQHPGKIPAGKLKALEAMPERAADPDVMQAQALMSLEEVGPNLYRADARAFDAILAVHKEHGNQLVSVATDPHTGVRTVVLETPDGTQVKVREKLGELGERTAPAVPVAEARRFEDWLEHAPLHPDRTVADTHRTRLRQYYARDPEGAIAAARHHGYSEVTAPAKSGPLEPAVIGRDPDAEAHPASQPRSDAERAYEQHVHDQRGEGPTTSRIGEEPMMGRSDFEQMYKAGYEYDPVTRRWRLGEHVATTKAGQAGSAITQSHATQVLGAVHSEAVGHQVLRKLVAGEAEALRLVGIEPPQGFDPRMNEWALGRRTADGAIVVVRGGKGEVDWSQIPGVEDLAHSHPLIDPITGKERLLKGQGGTGVVDLKALTPMGYMDMLYLLPSAGDLRFVALGGRQGHRVHTPYVSLGDGKIGNPTPGHNLDTVEIVIVRSEPHALFREGSEVVIWKAEIELWAGDTLLKQMDLYQSRISSGSFAADNPTFVPDTAWAPLPKDHPARLANEHSTPAATASDLEATIVRLAALGLRVSEPGVSIALGALKPKEAQALDYLSLQAIGSGGRIEGFPDWLVRFEDPAQRADALAEARLVHRELSNNPGRSVRFAADGASFSSLDSASPSLVPARVVEHVKSVANNEAQSALKKFSIEVTELDRALEAVKAKASAAGEQEYVDALKKNLPESKARDEASKKTRAEAISAAQAQARKAAERMARAAVLDGSAFGGQFSSQQQLNDYRSGRVGGAAKRLMSQDLPQKTEPEFLAVMQAEVGNGSVGAPRKITINGPPAQSMQMWEYADGTVVRYKPLGDAVHNAPTFTIEVRKDASLQDSGPDDAAFKVDEGGNAVPKNDRDIANPFVKGNNPIQHSAFEDAILGPIHFELRNPGTPP